MGHLAISLEFYPNKVMRNCPFNSGWVRTCYGKAALKAISAFAVSCSGVTLGSKTAIMVYVSISNHYDNDKFVFKSFLSLDK